MGREEQAEVKDRSGYTRHFNYTSIPASGVLVPPTPLGLISSFAVINRTTVLGVPSGFIVRVSAEPQENYQESMPVEPQGGSFGWSPKNCEQIKLTSQSVSVSVDVILNIDDTENAE